MKINATDEKIRTMIQIALLEQSEIDKKNAARYVMQKLDSIKKDVGNGRPVEDEVLDDMASRLRKVGIGPTDIEAAKGEDPKSQAMFLFRKSPGGGGDGAYNDLKNMVSGMVEDVGEVDDYVNEIIKRVKKKNAKKNKKSILKTS
jgi:hypothetical protein